MTCTVSIAVPGLSLVAADTRLNCVDSNGLPGFHDGPGDILIESDAGERQFIPYRFRKIRRAGFGWLAGSGNFVAMSQALERLPPLIDSNRAAVGSTWAAEREAIRTEAAQRPGYDSVGFDNTLVLWTDPRSVPLSVTAFRFALSLLPASPMGDYAISWPPLPPAAATDATKAAADLEFRSALERALSRRSVAEATRAAISVIAVAASLSNTVGPNVQIGITRAEGEGKLNLHYLEGSAAELLALTDQELGARIAGTE